jgi:hypothetical protein
MWATCVIFNHGDQIGRIFEYLAIVCFGQFLKKSADACSYVLFDNFFHVKKFVM